MEYENGFQHRKLAWALSLAGLIPFVLVALTLLFLDRDNAIVTPAFNLFRTYSAIILSFLGGIRWGYGIRPGNGNGEANTDKHVLLISVIPALLAWFTLLMPPEMNSLTLLVLLLAFCAHGAWDSLSANAKMLPAWFSKLRVALTFAVAACHIAVFFAIG